MSAAALAWLALVFGVLCLLAVSAALRMAFTSDRRYEDPAAIEAAERIVREAAREAGA